MRQLTYLLLAAIGATMAASCSVNRLEEPADTPRQGQPVLLTATAASGDAETRATLLGDGLDLYWSAEDTIRLWYPGSDEYGEVVCSTNTEPARVAEFQFWPECPFTAEGQKWAVYPNHEDWGLIEFHDGNITMPMPSLQTAAAGTFDPKALLAVAGFTGYEMSFSHVCGGLKFTVSHEGIRQIVLRSADETPLAGTVTVHMDSAGHPQVTELEAQTDAVKLVAPDGGTFQPGKWYYMTCLPAVMEHGFTLSFRTDTEIGVLTRTDKVEVKRAVWGKLENADAGVTFVTATEPLFNEIWYRKADNAQMTVDYLDGWGANLISQKDLGGGNFALVFDGPVTSIPYYAFANKDLVSFRLPGSVEFIDSGAFSDNPNLTEAILPEGLLSMDYSVFSYCYALNTFWAPASLHSLGGGVFDSCTSLDTFSGPLASADGHSLVSRSGELMAFAWTGTSPFTYQVPAGVMRIDESVFRDQVYMTEITLPNSLIEVEPQAFLGCAALNAFHGPSASPDERLLVLDAEVKAVAPAGLTDLVIPGDLVRSVAPYAFAGCSEIKTLTVGEGVESIGENAFIWCTSLEEVTLPESLQEIGESIFLYCGKLKSFSGKFATYDHLFLIKDGVLHAVAVATLTDPNPIPDTVTTIGPYAFYQAVGLGFYYGIPDTVTEICDGAFCGSSIVDIELPEKLEYLGSHVFEQCHDLGDLVIPASVTRIGYGIIQECPHLTELTVRAATPPDTGYNDPLYHYSLTKIYVPEASINAYKEADGWSIYSDIYVAIP